MPYHAMGYPDRATTLEIMRVLGEAGAELFEIGIPHSDPLADGPTIQTATYTALTQGTTVQDCLAMCRELRAAGMTQPFCAMTYYNPLFAYGVERFVQDALDAGIDGLIVPDLPPEEAEELEAACRRAGLATIYLLAPTSTDERIRIVAQHATGFIYLVSVTGITGARRSCRPTWPISSPACAGTPTSRWPWALALAAAPRRPPSPRLPTGSLWGRRWSRPPPRKMDWLLWRSWDASWLKASDRVERNSLPHWSKPFAR